MKSDIQLSIPINDYERLKMAADALIEEIGFFQLKVTRLLAPDLLPGTEILDDAVGEVAKLIYRVGEAA